MLLSALALAAGCGPPAFYKAGVAPDEQTRDSTACRQQAREPRESRNIVITPQGVVSYPYSDLDVQVYEDCMRKRGYSPAP